MKKVFLSVLFLSLFLGLSAHASRNTQIRDIVFDVTYACIKARTGLSGDQINVERPASRYLNLRTHNTCVVPALRRKGVPAKELVPNGYGQYVEFNNAIQAPLADYINWVAVRVIEGR